MYSAEAQKRYDDSISKLISMLGKHEVKEADGPYTYIVFSFKRDTPDSDKVEQYTCNIPQYLWVRNHFGVDAYDKFLIKRLGFQTREQAFDFGWLVDNDL